MSEISIGCPQKCFFCQYSWKNKFITDNNKGYKSGYSNREDLFQCLNWDTRGRYIVSAFDGLSEKTRGFINKPLSNAKILMKFKERNNSLNHKSIQLKLYNIYGYPFETNKNYYQEFDSLCKEVDKILKYKICILLNNTHFVPMPMTPMEREAVNQNNFRSIDYRFIGNQLKVIKPYTGTSELSAMEETIINRGTLNDKFEMLTSSKYRGLSKMQKKKILNNYFGSLLHKQNINVCRHIFYNIDKYIVKYDNTVRSKNEK